MMEAILCIDTPVQMISCTDTNGNYAHKWLMAALAVNIGHHPE